MTFTIEFYATFYGRFKSHTDAKNYLEVNGWKEIRTNTFKLKKPKELKKPGLPIDYRCRIVEIDIPKFKNRAMLLTEKSINKKTRA